MHSVRPIRSLKLLHRYDYTLKARFVLKIFNFCLEFFVMQKNGLIRKIRIISKFMAVNKELKYVYWPNLKKQGQSDNEIIEYNMTNIFIEKSYRKCGGETISRPFAKKSKLSISLDQYFRVFYSLFLFYAKLRAIKIYWN